MSPENSSRKKSVLGLAAALTLSSTIGVVVADPAQAAATAPVAVGTSASRAAGAEPFGDTDPSTPESVTFILKMRGKKALENTIDKGTTDFLTVKEFASAHGQSDADVAALTSHLQKFGLKTTVYAGNIGVNAKGTAAQFNQALQVRQQNWKVPAHKGRRAQIVHSPKSAPVLPARLSQMVTAVLGLDNYSPFVSKASTSGATTTPAAPGTGHCPVKTDRTSACRLPSDFSKQYGLSKLKATGKGRTIGIITLAALDEGAPETFWKNYAGLPDTGRKVTVKNIDGGPGPVYQGSAETDLDVQQAGGVAPGADVVVYQAPPSDAGFADAFLTAAAENVADTTSSSWGYSETGAQLGIASGYQPAALQAAFDTIFLQLAAQGQSTFIAAGDGGAYEAHLELGSTNISSGAPSNSAWVTSAGGTTAPWSGKVFSEDRTIQVPVTVTKERAWGSDYLWPALMTTQGKDLHTVVSENLFGGGGGYSVFENRPGYQKLIPGMGTHSAVTWLNPTDLQTIGGLTLPFDFTPSAKPVPVTGTGTGRVQPDVSANADPMTGYLLYAPSLGAGQELQWDGGGTSFVAPQFNGATAVMSEVLGRRIGLWNPALYRFALRKDSPVKPLSDRGPQNDNLHYTGTPGTLYNPAVGLGTPDFAEFTRLLKALR